MFRRRRPIAFVNGRVWMADGMRPSIRVRGRVVDRSEQPHAGDLVVDLGGAVVLPGLVNAHDHLELNHYGALKTRDRYRHADDWIADLRPRLQTDETIRRNARFPLADRLFIGGLKNLLAGVTTVAHHNPRYREIDRHCPVRVLERYRWAHSFSMEAGPVGAGGEPGGQVAATCAATPPDTPFLVHVAEGSDERAVQELVRFTREGCLRANSVIVHGVAHTVDSWRAAVASGTGLVWCPASNAFLLGETVPLARLFAAAPGSAAFVCLGSDSRLTGARDLLDEVRVASAHGLPHGALLPMVTSTAARLLKQPIAGRLAPDGPADLIIVPPDPLAPEDPEAALLAARRQFVRLVMIGGDPIVSDREYAGLFTATGGQARSIVVDGTPKLARDRLARRVLTCAIHEPGFEVIA